MPEYCILVLPAANRVYAKSSVRLMSAELEVFNRAVLGGKIDRIAESEIGGVPYLVLAGGELTARDVSYLSNLSSLYALFERHHDALRPITVTPLDKFGSDLVTIQKYSGKTNEHFTKLLLNVAAVNTDAPDEFLDRPIRVLDPLAGRGTTLNQALTYGWNVAGIELSGKDFDAYAFFIGTWLKNNRIKHKIESSTIRRDRERLGKRIDISVGLTKEQFKAGDARQISAVNGDTVRSGDFFKAGSYDVIVTDTPYGVQHGSHQQNLSRSPVGLLERAVPGWARLLRVGGTIGLSWNTYVARREQLVEVLTDNGLDVLDIGDFAHRVDQAINRDLLVARKR